eukprot:CAMPEP_0206185286 /NCGR_PEP_ID=MMETSP0166-20121206/1713_1 /ASSEMBLY_ACC=CAM_ASM_000260 /TAXON_ID=95228 /ORGANISM="Vannella robusta, Strain DIVA3 518/3/11/1/6" /LENGTH=67 /DNA_ID=CAMNT_0053600443 /DNA_START=53 /DNA_END=256 /DNA_ORIENTATION=+
MAKALREQGNKHYGLQEYPEAITCYGKQRRKVKLAHHNQLALDLPSLCMVLSSGSFIFVEEKQMSYD